ncbi:hypothetical protein ABFX02_03G000900 [Erythranthe guttata]|nr:PREDICTED: uncharacterized protein LOC105953695 isoform X2 [Erythranthe guttata]|eukprot:XP_012832844.1 PREDICTED: uncharacterized protein LOC105953695 isoform X2 [Erythranthe guttata]
MALCVLTADWKSDNLVDSATAVTTKGRGNPVDGLLAIVVDHGLRPESAEEADLVRNRVSDMGIKCEVARCDWLDGRPGPGHLQEAARNKRYETLQTICMHQQISILLVAHHADDQAELFILRLSRNSGVLGLAGMSFASQMFSQFPDFCGQESKPRGILIVRPLLDFSKEDMYDICRSGNQQWVEDPTNRSPVYARNRIRMSLSNLSSSIFKIELQATISACRRTRLLVDKFCNLLLKQAVTIMHHGYAVIDLETLRSMEVKDIYLAKFVTSVVQFISQRHRPVRGKAVKLLQSYIRTFPSKTSLTVGGCYLCPAPGSKGTKVLVCCSINLSFPVTMKLFHPFSCFPTSDLEQIVKESEAYLDRFTPDAYSSAPFSDMASSSESVLIEAKQLGILSHSTYESIVSLQQEESDNFKSKAEAVSKFASKDEIQSSNDAATDLNNFIMPGQVGYFMDRFVVDWKMYDGEGDCFCSSGDERGAEVRHMVDADWLYLSELSKKKNKANVGPPEENNHETIKDDKCSSSHYSILSASRAIECIKSIPVAARRSMPVLVNAQGLVLSIPSIGFAQCPHLMKVSVVFSPRIPLGGGHTSFL